SILRTLPDAALMAAADEPSLKAALEFMRAYEAGLSAVRYPRDNVSDALGEECPPFVLGKARAISEPEKPDVAVLALGVCVIDALKAIESLGPEVRVALYDARFAKPVDTDLIRRLLEAGLPIITVEDHGIHGGFGAAVIEAAADMGLNAGMITRLALPDSWIYQDGRAAQLAEAGIDKAGIAAVILRVCDRQPSAAVIEVKATSEARPHAHR